MHEKTATMALVQSTESGMKKKTKDESSSTEVGMKSKIVTKDDGVESRFIRECHHRHEVTDADAETVQC